MVCTDTDKLPTARLIELRDLHAMRVALYQEYARVDDDGELAEAYLDRAAEALAGAEHFDDLILTRTFLESLQLPF
ncbi:hypothetical protein H0X32_02055 [Patescibacteria group bacterium]|nr:hypothetical protein [Patescibacteria group bacterium]